MKKLFAILLVLAIATLCASALAEGYVQAYASPTYVRTGPGLGYTIVDKLVTGACYSWAGSVQYDSRGVAWYDVYYFGGYGWVSSLHGALSGAHDYHAGYWY